MKWAQQAGERPSCVPELGGSGIQLGTLQCLQSGIRKLNANSKHRAKNRANPQNVPWGCLRCFGEKRSVETCNGRDMPAAEVPQAAVGTAFTPSRENKP